MSLTTMRSDSEIREGITFTYSSDVVDLLVSLSDEDAKTFINSRLNSACDCSILLAVYLLFYDVINWKIAVMLFEYCDFDYVKNDMRFLKGDHERAMQRLHYLKYGDV